MLACVALAGQRGARRSAERHPRARQRRADHQLRHPAAQPRCCASSRSGKQGEKDAIEQLIDERLMLQEAKRRNVTITRRARSTPSSPGAPSRRKPERRRSSSQAMRQAGIDAQTFRNFLRANMAWTRDRARALPRDGADQRAGCRRRARRPREAGGAGRRRTNTCCSRSSSSSRPGRAAARTPSSATQANAFRGGFQGCDNSLQQAQGMPTVVVKPTVRREESQISERPEGGA